jgi:hypothetical protein
MWGLYAFNDLTLPSTACSGQFIACIDINYQINIKFSHFPVPCSRTRGAQPKMSNTPVQREYQE